MPKMLVRINCTAPKLMPTSLALLRRSCLLHVSHITRMCATLTFSSAVASLGRPDRPSSSLLSLPLLKNLEKRILQKQREPIYTKTADSVLLSLFMRTNGKCNNYHAPSTGLSGILLSVRTYYFWRTSIWKNINTLSMYGEKFTNSTRHNDSDL